MEPKHGSVLKETFSGEDQAQVEVEAESRSQIGAAAESISYNGEHGSSASPPPVYITITDPINGPSFQPSPTKPIPRWMRQLPNGKEREQVHILATTSSAAAESEGFAVPSLLQSVPEEQKPPSQMTYVSATASAISEAILAYNDRRMAMSTPPKMHHQRPEYGARAPTPFYTGGEMGVEYLKKYHLRALEERERGLQESKTGNIALKRLRELGVCKAGRGSREKHNADGSFERRGGGKR
ncbi:hypothetical protein VE04_04209 [Pseudogymnoascus sp. 24MN13]|nr:hypothetical protein VE04_04209 [Pseudogymnoascus sp. 24MN13]